MRAIISQVARFGAVGLLGFVVDVGIFNLLRATLLSPDAVHDGPLWAKVISTSIAIVVNWLGNRYWTFRNERRAHWIREAVEFALVSIGGLLIAVGCLWFSEYVLGFRSVLADNIATNVVGLGARDRVPVLLLPVLGLRPGARGAGGARGDRSASRDARECHRLTLRAAETANRPARPAPDRATQAVAAVEDDPTAAPARSAGVSCRYSFHSVSTSTTSASTTASCAVWT